MIRHHLMVMTDPEHLEELEHGIPQLQIRQIQVKYVKLLSSVWSFVRVLSKIITPALYFFK